MGTAAQTVIKLTCSARGLAAGNRSSRITAPPRQFYSSDSRCNKPVLLEDLLPFLPCTLILMDASLLHCQVSKQAHCKPPANVCCSQGSAPLITPQDIIHTQKLGCPEEDQPSMLSLQKGNARCKAKKGNAAHGGGKGDSCPPKCM